VGSCQRAGSPVVAQAGWVLLTGTVGVSNVDRELPAAVLRWPHPLAVHDPSHSDHESSGDGGAERRLPGRYRAAARGVVVQLTSDPTVSCMSDALAGVAGLDR